MKERQRSLGNSVDAEEPFMGWLESTLNVQVGTDTPLPVRRLLIGSSIEEFRRVIRKEALTEILFVLLACPDTDNEFKQNWVNSFFPSSST